MEPEEDCVEICNTTAAADVDAGVTQQQQQTSFLSTSFTVTVVEEGEENLPGAACGRAGQQASLSA